VVVDKQGIDEAQYQQDLSDCRTVADEVSTGRNAAEGAGGGAVIGGISVPSSAILARWDAWGWWRRDRRGRQSRGRGAGEAQGD